MENQIRTVPNYHQHNKRAEMFRALGHPLRLQIAEHLIKAGKRQTVTEIYTALGIEQAIASCNLGIMRNAGVLEAIREGKNTFYDFANPKIIAVVNNALLL